MGAKNPADPLDRPLEDIFAGRAKLDEIALKRYGQPLEPVSADPRHDILVTDSQRTEQVVTLLRTLGYLRDNAVVSSGRSGGFEMAWSTAEIRTAWEQWKREWTEHHRAARPAVIIETEIDDHLGPSEVPHDEVLRRLLKACATLEGECTLTSWPAEGTISLASRIILARLALFGIDGADPGAAMPAKLRSKVIQRARGIMGERTWTALDIVNKLGDIAALSAALREKLESWWLVLRSPGEPFDLPSAVPYDVDRDGRKLSILNLVKDSSREWNELALRVLQIRLWTLGFYEGEIDGRWDTLTDAAYAGFKREYGVKKHQMNPVEVVGTAGRFIVYRIAEVLAFIAEEVDQPAEATERADIDGMLEKMDGEHYPEVWDKLSEVETDPTTPLPRAELRHASFALASRGNLRRKRYWGWRAVFATIGRILRKVTKKVKDFAKQILKAAGRGLVLVRNIARHVIDSTRTIFRIGKLAMQRLAHWITGTPITTGTDGGIALTRWSMDFDTVHLVDPRCPPETIADHQRKLDWMQRSFEVMLNIAARIIGVVLAFTNWLLLAWQLLKLARDAVKLSRSPLFQELLAEANPT